MIREFKNNTYVSSDYSVKDTDDVLNVDTTLTPNPTLNVYLPPSASIYDNQREIYINDFAFNFSAVTVTLNVYGTDTINGQSSVILSNSGEVCKIMYVEKGVWILSQGVSSYSVGVDGFDTYRRLSPAIPSSGFPYVIPTPPIRPNTIYMVFVNGVQQYLTFDYIYNSGHITFVTRDFTIDKNDLVCVYYKRV